MAAAGRMGEEVEEEEKRRGLGPILLRQIVGTRDAGGERRAASGESWYEGVSGGSGDGGGHGGGGSLLL